MKILIGLAVIFLVIMIIPALLKFLFWTAVVLAIAGFFHVQINHSAGKPDPIWWAFLKKATSAKT